MREEIYVINSRGEAELFDVGKLELSLRKSHAPLPLVNNVIKMVVGNLKDGVTTSEIYNEAYALLRKLEKPVAMRYSMRRAIMDLGPTGFPFEKLIGEILRLRGYSVEVDKVVDGHCASHEVDILGYNDNELIAIEAKYHNSIGIQTDLKVALYIKARIDDLKKANIPIAGRERQVTEGWIVTNTKFTSSAIKYGECQGIKMLGWNYPAEGSLHDIVEEAKLHPLTILTTLSATDKKALLESGAVLCSSLRDHPEYLSAVGITGSHKEKTLEEIGLLYAS